jgi:hypothetical protein
MSILHERDVEFEVLRALAMKGSIFWYKTPYRRFRGTCCFLIQDRIISSGSYQLYAGFLIFLFFDLED